MSICHCLIQARHAEEHKKMKEMGLAHLISAVKKGLTYQLAEDDIFHLMDMAHFYKENTNLCVSDVTNGKKVQIRVTEYDRDTCKKIREQSNIDYDLFLK